MFNKKLQNDKNRNKWKIYVQKARNCTNMRELSFFATNLNNYLP